MSIAGRREGLDGSRSSLFYEAVRIVKEMRCATDGRYPRYIVWENVPYALQHINDVLPCHKAGADVSPGAAALPFRCAHLLDDADLLHKKAGAGAG